MQHSNDNWTMTIAGTFGDACTRRVLRPGGYVPTA